MRTRFATLIAAVLLAAGLAAPAASYGRQAPALDTLSVGSLHLPASSIRDDSSESVLTIPDSTAPHGERVIGRVSERQHVVGGGSPMLARVSTFTGAGSSVTDSILTSAADLRPVSEISHQTSKLMRLRFDGRQVTGDVTPTGKATVAIDQTTAVAPFNSSDIDLVVGALPFAVGYAALVATYEYESGGLRLDTVRVTGRAPLPGATGAAARDTWVVRLSRGDASWSTMWVDVDTKRVLRSDHASRARAWTLRIVRQ